MVPAKQSHEEDSKDEGEVVSISDVLHELNTQKPDLDYIKYEDALHEKGIMYADGVTDIDDIFLEKQVGMAKGVIGGLWRATRRVVKGKMAKQVCLDNEKENVRP